MKAFLKLIKKSILFYTVLFVAFYCIFSYILWKFNLAFMNWINILALILSCIGIIYGTRQFFEEVLKSNKIRKWFKRPVLAIEIFLSIIFISFILLFIDSQDIVKKDGVKMVKETHSVLLSNWINYYDYKGFALRGKNIRIYEAHDDYIGDYLYTIYYDEYGNKIGSKDIK